MEIKTTDYDGIYLEEYNGKYSINALRVSNEKFYTVWAKYTKGKDVYQEKDWPVKVNLGDKETAKTTLLNLLAELGEAPF